MRTLYVAAGGGGDAVGALLARRALGDTDERPPLVTTCAWERLRIDPVPGPRARGDFTGLGLVGEEPCEVLASSATVASGRSVLPRLAQTSGARIFLHDFEGGAEGLAAQLRHLAGSLEVDQLIILDVGGDIMATGSEPELRSPLADSLTLAAALQTGVPTAMVVMGPGADAELPESAVINSLTQAGAVMSGQIVIDDVRSLAPVLSWHPTEATALAAASSSGVRGFVAMRRGHEPVPITAQTSRLWVISEVWPNSFPLSQAVRGTRNMSEVESIMRSIAVNEIDFERRVAACPARRANQRSLSDVIREMEVAGATHITYRRLADSLDAPDLDIIRAQPSPEGGLWARSELFKLRTA